eukprot:scaffold5925_cov122-Isochrysis_galbana.AAC.1
MARITRGHINPSASIGRVAVVRARLLYRLLALGRWRLPLCPVYACLCACRTRQRGGFMRRVYQWSEEQGVGSRERWARARAVAVALPYGAP